RLIKKAFDLAGGPPLVDTVFKEKVQMGTTLLTTVHHRESVQWLRSGQVDIAIVWQSEARWAIAQGLSATMILPDPKHNPTGRYYIAEVRNSPHPAAKKAFMKFMLSSTAQKIYQTYGFDPVDTSSDNIFEGF
ncbi:MAG: substrate-binding domain-containing protein, partial [Firmicutes bacterium]|nr:substrate-binding domain-containing protein [Bacillota bacterium]